MIGRNIVGYGGASLPWPRIGLRNPVREPASGQATKTALPHSIAPRPAANGTDREPVRTPTALPGESDLNRPEEVIMRMRIRYPGERPAFPSEGAEQAAKPDNITDVGKSESPAEIMNETKCRTCARRKYQDGSDDPGVSFKTPTKMNPEQAATAVRGHEQEHVVRERAEAEREDRKVVSQSVTIHTDICPECGRVYVSGGVTRTVTAADNQDEETGLSAPETFEATA